MRPGRAGWPPTAGTRLTTVSVAPRCVCSVRPSRGPESRGSSRAGLAYQETDWTYCTPEDRRYYTEQENINPAGRDQLTNSTDAARVLPRGCFDVGDGYLNPEDCLVYSWTEEGKAIRPAEDKSAEFPSELEWARANCREGGADAPEGLMETDVAAKRIQAIQRGKQARRDAAENKKAATSVQANFRGWKSRQSMKQKAEAAEEEEQAQAATKIAAMHRGKAARRERAEQAEAATKMQAIQRGRMARKGKEPVAIAPDTEVAYDPAEADAATLIQAQMRGRATRREMKAQAEGKKIEEELGLTGSEEESAAIARMQAQQRGKMARKEMAEQQNAASKIAAVQRGKQDRQRVQGMKIEKELGLTGSAEESAAIARMQAAQRGKMSRKEMAEQQAVRSNAHSMGHTREAELPLY